MIVIGVDPGPTQSAMVMIRPEPWRLFFAEHKANREIEEHLLDVAEEPEKRTEDFWLAIEGVSYYGKDFSVGRAVMDTCREIGRLEYAAESLNFNVALIFRQSVRTILCGHARVGDAQVRTAIIDRFGGSRAAAIGTKKKPGPLYGVSGHCWSALAVALTALETNTVEATV